MPAVKISESKIEAKVVKYCRDHGIYTRKFASPSNRGVPDRLFVMNGKVMFIELKRPGNEPTALQHHELDVLRAHGAHATWADSYQGAVLQLQRYLLNPTDPRSLI
jgi:Holliday junction resolvase